MNNKRLRKIKAKLAQLRSNPIGIRPRVLIRIALQLERERKAGFTNEPTFVRKLEPALSPPLSIPAHAVLKRGTAKSVINALLDDVDTWALYLLDHESDNDDDDDSDEDFEAEGDELDD